MRLRDLVQRNRPTSIAISRPSDSFEPMSSLQSQINRVFSDFLSNDNWPMLPSAFQGSQRGGFVVPSIDVAESENSFVITAELPGLSSDDVDVAISNDAITISGEKQEEFEDQQGNYLVSERSYGSFQRVIPVPDVADAENAQATFNNGVLCIELPKREESVSRSRKLEVAAGQQTPSQQQRAQQRSQQQQSGQQQSSAQQRSQQAGQQQAGSQQRSQQQQQAGSQQQQQPSNAQSRAAQEQQSGSQQQSGAQSQNANQSASQRSNKEPV